MKMLYYIELYYREGVCSGGICHGIRSGRKPLFVEKEYGIFKWKYKQGKTAAEKKWKVWKQVGAG